MRERRQAVRALALAALAAVLSACAGIPTSGPVRAGEQVGAESTPLFVRAEAASPRAGATATEIVRGFLVASATVEDDQQTARRFLTPDAVASWRPEAQVTVYDGDQLTLAVDAAQGRVVASMVQEARIDAQGRYDPLPAPAPLQVTFDLAAVDGELRIAGLPDGIFLTPTNLRSGFAHVNLYYLTPDRRAVVPDPVFLPQGSNLAATLVARLLQGPTSSLAPAVVTAFPAGTGLTTRSVRIEGGTAVVDLDDGVRAASSDARQWMSAQLVWTLKALPRVEAVQVQVEGEPLLVRNAGQVQSTEEWAEYDPNVVSSLGPLAVQEARLVRWEGGEFVPVEGPLGNGDLPVRAPALTADGGTVAVLSADATTVYAGPLLGGAAPEVVAEGAAFARPAWDRLGGLWLVDSGDVRVRLPDGSAQDVVLPDLGAARVVTLRLSGDGTRVVVVTRGAETQQVLVGVVVRGEGDEPTRIEGLRRIVADLVEIRDADWSAQDEVVVLGRERAGLWQPYAVDVDGYEVVAGNTIEGEALSLAVAPERPLLVATEPEPGQPAVLTEAAALDWRTLSPARDPAYPG